ncbi:MAG: SurA N-terminal domain-containing protein [Candidatus Omnitrophota bacterium]|jgi:parvulin-like peptidyl-prolyl isomerase
MLSKKTKKTVWIILLIAILPGFVLWGFFDSLKRSDRQSFYAGRIYGKKITSQEYRTALQAAKTLAVMRFGENLQKIQQYLNLDEQAWQRLIILEEASRRRIKISDREVVAAIQGYPFMQNKKGDFDEKQYRQVLRYVFHVQARVFEEQVRGDLTIGRLFENVTSGVKVTDEEIKESYNKANEELNLNYIAALPAEITPGLSVTDKEIKDFFSTNSLRFKKPLSYNLEYVLLGADAQESRIRDTLRRLSKAEDFKAEAKKMDMEAKETGFFPENGPVPGIGWSSELTARLANGTIGRILPPVKTTSGIFILKIKEKKEPYVPALEEAKDEVKKRILEQKSALEARARIDSCLAKIKSASEAKQPVSLEQLAKSLSLKSGQTGDFKFGSYIEGIGASDVFYNEAKKLSTGQYSGVIETASGLYIVTPGSFKTIDEKKFAQEKAEFSRTVLLKKQNEVFGKFLQDLEKRSGAKRF